MATIDDVIAWACTLPAWQGDAVRRLLLAGEEPLSAQDYSEILALAKAELKLEPPPDGLSPVPPAAGMFSGAPATTSVVKLLAIDDVRNVNIIRSGQTQPFAETGVTVVYGDNGSGKSGYARILKLACQSRDKDEQILPNVFAAKPTGVPTATLKIKQDSTTRDIEWVQGSAVDSALANITVFDSRCARVITDDRNEITYLPYGGDVFQKVVEIVQKVRADIESEIVDLVPIEDSAVIADTPAAAFLESLSEDTKDEDVESATAWTSQDDEELLKQEELARTSDSIAATKEITRLNKIMERINQVIAAETALVNKCGAFTNEAIEKILAELGAAKLAHASALAEKQTPEPLPGVASTNQWEILYQAAKRYSEEVAYPGERFPKTYDAVCVLCQQPLGEEALARFERFKRYMEDVTSTVLTTKRDALKSLRTNFEELTPLAGVALDSVCDDLSDTDVKLSEALRAYHLAVAERKSAVLALLQEGEDPAKTKSLVPWPASLTAELKASVESLKQKATDITKASKPDELKKLVTAIAEAKSRKALNAREAEISAFVVKARRNAELRSAVAKLRTGEITKQGTIIIRENLTPELLGAFKAELTALGATAVPISLKPSGTTGETTHEMLLEGATVYGRTRMSEVLSEGEARVIALAGFLAELQLAPHSNSIVLDDPVSSLDHIYTGKTAERIAREGLKRQVIVFTHNIAFLMELKDACLALARSGTPVELAVHALRRSGSYAGITTDGAPWHSLKIGQRAQYLEECVHKIKSLHKDNVAEYNQEAARIYGLLREAWEACIEEDLFYSVVCRYRNSVQTLKLMEVTIEDTDIHEIDLQMSKASTWMTGHDKSKALDQNRPAPDKIIGDINSLRAFSEMVIVRRKETEKRRKNQLKP